MPPNTATAVAFRDPTASAPSATVIAMAIGLPLGVHSGWKRGKRVDRGLLGFFLAVQNLPIFVVGSLVFVVFSAKLGLFPYGGATSALTDYQGIERVLDAARTRGYIG